MTSLALLENYRPANYRRVVRDGNGYVQTERIARDRIQKAVIEYNQLTATDQYARLLRDEIDFWLRRYHGYCIKDNFGGHYREKDLSKKDKVDFEHVIPAATIRDMLIQNRLTVEQAMNAPTCLLRRRNHSRLKKLGLASRTPNAYLFWSRYQALSVDLETHDRLPIDQGTWTLDDHYAKFL